MDNECGKTIYMCPSCGVKYFIDNDMVIKGYKPKCEKCDCDLRRCEDDDSNPPIC